MDLRAYLKSYILSKCLVEVYLLLFEILLYMFIASCRLVFILQVQISQEILCHEALMMFLNR